MKEHLPRVYWRDVAPEDSRLLSGEKTTPVGDDWIDFRPLAAAWLDGLGAVEETTHKAAALPAVRAGSLTGPVTGTLREIEVPGLLSVRELDQPAVSRLVALNPAARRSALIPEGTVFLGGAQNRLIQQPVLVPPGLHELPVFCVEMGRWDPEAPVFNTLGTLPVLLAHQIGARPGAGADAQAAVWELVYESLTMLGQLNPTLNVDGWRTEVDVGAAHGARAHAQPDWRGLYSIDPEIGLGLFSLAPHDAFGGRTLEAVRRERDWRGCLLANARGAREFFRIFDESKKLAIRCLPDGRPLRDIRKRPILFEFSENNPELSFRPPLERPPGPPPLSFAGEEHFGGFEEFLNAIRASRVRLTRAGLPDTFQLELRHPEFALRGAGLVYKNELASLDVTAFRPFAAVRG